MGQSKLHIRNLNALTILTRHSQALAPYMLPTLFPHSYSLLMQIPTRRTIGFILLVQIMKKVSSFCLMELAALASPLRYCLGQCLCKDELRLYTSGIIQLHLWRAVQFRAHSHVSADPCQNSLQAGSCIIFFACPSSKWTMSSSVSVT